MTTGQTTNLDGTSDEVVTAEELASVAKRSAGDDAAFAAAQAIGDHNTVDTSSAPTIDVVRRGLRSLLIAWDGVEAVHGHGYYEAQIDTDPAFGTPDDFYKGKATFTVFDGLTTGTTYYARVRAVDAAGNTGPWSTSTGGQNTDTAVTDDIGDGEVTDAKINSLTVAKITAGTISGKEIILSNSTSSIIRSSNFASGSAGWRIRGNGDAEFNNVTVRGTIIATAGEISGVLTVSGGLTVQAAADTQWLDAAGNLRFEIGERTEGAVTNDQFVYKDAAGTTRAVVGEFERLGSTVHGLAAYGAGGDGIFQVNEDELVVARPGSPFDVILRINTADGLRLAVDTAADGIQSGQVTAGAVDSGGAGFRMLRIPN